MGRRRARGKATHHGLGLGPVRDGHEVQGSLQEEGNVQLSGVYVSDPVAPFFLHGVERDDGLDDADEAREGLF